MPLSTLPLRAATAPCLDRAKSTPVTPSSSSSANLSDSLSRAQSVRELDARLALAQLSNCRMMEPSSPANSYSSIRTAESFGELDARLAEIEKTAAVSWQASLDQQVSLVPLPCSTPDPDHHDSLVGVWSYLNQCYEIVSNEDALHFLQYDSEGALIQGELVADGKHCFTAELMRGGQACGMIRLLQQQDSGMLTSNFMEPGEIWGCDVNATKLPVASPILLPQVLFVPVLTYPPLSCIGNLQESTTALLEPKKRERSRSLTRPSSIEVCDEVESSHGTSDMKKQVTEDVWEMRSQHRQDGVGSVKSNAFYYQHQQLPLHKRPQTPNAYDRNIAERQWEKELATWRSAWREIDGVHSLMAIGYDAKESLRAWHMAEKRSQDEKEYYKKNQKDVQDTGSKRSRQLRYASR